MDSPPESTSVSISKPGSGTGKRKVKRPKKLAPIEDTQIHNKNSQSLKSKTIQHKRDLVEAVRRVAPSTVHVSPLLYHDIASNLKTTNIDDSDVRQQLSIVEDGVNGAARRYNDLRILCDRKSNELKKKLDELDGLKLEYDNMMKMKVRDTPESHRIDQLKEDIVKIEEDIMKSAHYMRQLQHILQRLKRNQIKFDAHMNGMDESRKAIEKEFDEIRLLRRGLDSGLAKAQLVYEETSQRVQISRKERSDMLAVRKGELKNAQRLKQWMKDRQIIKAALATELRGDLTKEEEHLLRTQLKEKEEKTKRLQRANEESQRKVSQMDEAFMRIKQITGVSSLEDMVDKFAAQRINKKNLEKEVVEVEHKLAEVKKANMKLEQGFQEQKSSGVGEADLNKESNASLEEKITAARHDYKITKATSDRLHAVLISLRQGAHALLQRVNPYLSLIDTGVFELTSGGLSNLNPEDVDISTETMDALGTAEQVLSKMLEIIGGGDPSPNKMGNNLDNMDLYSGSQHHEVASEHSILTEAPSMLNNVRIRSKRTKMEAEIKESDVGKAAAEQYTFSRTDIDSVAESDATSFADSSVNEVNSPQKLNSEPNNPLLISPTKQALDTIGEDEILTRNNVKRVSSRITLEAERKSQQAQRAKKLAEKMVTGEVDESGLALIAKIKAQQVVMSKLCSHHHPATLPDTVTIRDDAMTKTQAFLTILPNLE